MNKEICLTIKLKIEKKELRLTKNGNLIDDLKTNTWSA